MYNTNERDKMTKEYDHADHMAVMSELLVLYQLKNETQDKINVANAKLNEILSRNKVPRIQNERSYSWYERKQVLSNS